MVRNKAFLIKNLFLFIVSIYFCMGNLNAVINLNGSDTGYNSGPKECSKMELDNNSIRIYIEDAAGYFLQAHADILYFSNLYELSGDKVDFDQWRQVLDSAGRSVQATKAAYNSLIAAAEATPYYQPVIDKLKVFDYSGFESTYNLDNDAFPIVEGYLKNGNINGVYREALSRLETIETILDRIKGAVYIGMMPELSDVWQLNEACSKKLMFGQYVAMVFLNLDQ